MQHMVGAIDYSVDGICPQQCIGIRLDQDRDELFPMHGDVIKQNPDVLIQGYGFQSK